MEENIVHSIPVIAMKRYIDVKVIMIKGLDKINEFLKMIQYNNVNDLKSQYGIVELEKGRGIELIQINNSLTPEGEVVAIATVGIILCVDMNKTSAELYRRN